MDSVARASQALGLQYCSSTASSLKDGGKQLNPLLSHSAWERVEATRDSAVPCQRSLHAGAVWKDNFIVFGGYDGHHRVNDLYSFNFLSSHWKLLSSVNAPSPRDRHIAVVYNDSLYIFGGFDGSARVNDLHCYDLVNNQWRNIQHENVAPPSPRHSHAAVVYQDSMFVFGGYDGSYRSDLYEYSFANRSWYLVCSLFGLNHQDAGFIVAVSHIFSRCL
jgi:leucine-zipper-like transcriptional regulator 1